MAASSKTASAPSETKLVRELADILDKSGLAELEYETDAVAIRLSRATGAAPVMAAAPAASAPATAAPAPSKAELAAAANHSSLYVYDGFMVRFHPQWHWLRTLDIGRVDTDQCPFLIPAPAGR